jgi:hypothetical protein
MIFAIDLKSPACKGVPVRFRLRAPNTTFAQIPICTEKSAKPFDSNGWADFFRLSIERMIAPAMPKLPLPSYIAAARRQTLTDNIDRNGDVKRDGPQPF